MAADSNGVTSTGDPPTNPELKQDPPQVSKDDDDIDVQSMDSALDHSSGNHSHQLNVDNPLKDFTLSQLDEKVRKFAEIDEGLVKHLKILQSGARLARDKPDAVKNDPIVRSEINFFKNKKGKDKEERTGLWGQSKFLKGSLVSTCLAGIVQGWTQSAINGSSVGIRDDFNLHYKKGEKGGNTKDLWVFGVLTAIPFLVGGVLAFLVSDPLQEYKLGRRGAIAIACLLSMAATIGQSFSKTVTQLAACRAVTGLTLAAKASTAPLLIAEVSPRHLRGQLLSTWQLSDAFGIFLGFSSNLAVLSISASSKVIWRIQTATILIPTFALLAVVYLMPESPRYLMKKKKHSKALESFTFLRPAPVSALLAARDLVYAHFQLQAECKFIEYRRDHKEDPMVPISDRLKRDVKGDEEKLDEDEEPLYDIKRTNYPKRLFQVFQDGRSRRALVCATTAMVAQQLTGINTIAFLSGTLLDDVHASNRTGAWVGFGIGLCNFLFGLPAFWLLDYVGRASMLLLGFIPMFVLMLILAFGFELDSHGGGAHITRVGVFIAFYIIAYSPTAGPAPFAISAEVFPLVVREVGHSMAVAVNFISLGFVLLIFPSLSNAIGGYRDSLSLFAALNIVALVLCFLFVPETKGRTLEELQFTFDLPTTDHIKYRWKFVLPWVTKNYLLPTVNKLNPWSKKSDKKVEGYVPFYLWARIKHPSNTSNPNPSGSSPGDPNPGNSNNQ